LYGLVFCHALAWLDKITLTQKNDENTFNKLQANRDTYQDEITQNKVQTKTEGFKTQDDKGLNEEKL